MQTFMGKNNWLMSEIKPWISSLLYGKSVLTTVGLKRRNSLGKKQAKKSEWSF
jgi:hypothetical protein